MIGPVADAIDEEDWEVCKEGKKKKKKITH
jgi:hypothetical protein